MASMAGLLTEAGHRVTGSDEKIYPPMDGQISRLGIRPFEGYAASNIGEARPELVIIGNVIRRDNPEAQEVLRRGIRYLSMPAALSEIFLKDRTPVVVAGTHGKTTSTSLLAWLLTSCGLDPGFLIGGIGINFQKSHAVGKGSFFVVEGDEYDTAFFDKGPKFLHYRPHALLLTSIEFDHADIYKDLQHVLSSFRKLIGIMPSDGLIVANADDDNVMHITSEAKCRVVHYGLKSSAGYYPLDVDVSQDGMSFFITGIDQRFTLHMWGEHNLSNAIGAIAVLLESGQDPKLIASGLGGFLGVRRRQELVAMPQGITIIDDFAHHPTAVRKTIESVRQRYPDRRIWAIFEPRSNTSRRKFFQKEYVDAFLSADRVIIAKPYREDAILREERLDVDSLADDIIKRGGHAFSIPSTDNIIEFVMRSVIANDVLLVMSNGAFDNICSKLAAAIERRRIVADRSEITPGRVPK